MCAPVIDDVYCMESRSCSGVRVRCNLPDMEEDSVALLSDSAGSRVRGWEREGWVVKDDGRKNG